jgi:hypothetical protein
MKKKLQFAGGYITLHAKDAHMRQKLAWCEFALIILIENE